MINARLTYNIIARLTQARILSEDSAGASKSPRLASKPLTPRKRVTQEKHDEARLANESSLARYFSVLDTTSRGRIISGDVS